MQGTLQRVHPEQHKIGYGDHWFRVLSESSLTFDLGYVPTMDEYLTEQERYAVSLDKIVGRLRSWVVNRLTMMQHAEVVHRSEIWPLPTDLYFAFKRADWDYRNLRAIDANRFKVLFEDWRNRWPATPERQPRRPYEQFVSEVQEVSGVEFRWHRIADRHLVLRFPSAARTQEASTALESAMFHVKHVGENALSVLDRSEA